LTCYSIAPVVRDCETNRMESSGAKVLVLLTAWLGAVSGQLITRNTALETTVKDVRIFCNSNDIVLALDASTKFNGMIYPKGLSKNSSCMAEFRDQINPVLYKLPLKSCNTMSTELDDGIEYFNTVVVQPHRKLVTNQGRGYHVRCKYETREKTVSNEFNVTQLGAATKPRPPLSHRNSSLSQLGGFDADGKEDLNGTSLDPTPLSATAAIPACFMRIFAGEPSERQVAENVRIGDPLTMVISLENQQIYGMRITGCLVRDGLGWGEQQLINDEGCPVDYEILGPFEYSSSKTTAAVRFQAHKFPYTASVYYQCNVQLCIKNAGGCDDVPPVCVDGVNKRRRRRDVSDAEVTAEVEEGLTSFEVFSGVFVNEEDDIPEEEDFGVQSEQSGVEKEDLDPDKWCLSTRTFAVGIALAGLLLMVAVVAVLFVLLCRRRRKGDSVTGSSIYSGPYTNTAYSHSS